jgi:hypothetical protein
MKKHAVLTAVFFASAFLVSAPESKAQYCDFPPKELAGGQHREYRGPFKNKAYGYSVVIPENLVGYDGANPFYQQGFGIPLGAEPKSYVSVIGDKNSLGFARPSDATSQLLKYLDKDGRKVESSKITESQLGPLKAALLIATYICPGSTEPYTTASIVAISADKSTLYEVSLYARSDRFDQDRVVLDALAKSWKRLGT